jgi:exopolyphosphatase/guanosine-5'-triphosphate,3'-diphosphate pyrophosphatase
MPPPPVKLAAKDRELSLRFPRGWLRANPLTAADLEQERSYLGAAGYGLKVS